MPDKAHRVLVLCALGGQQCAVVVLLNQDEQSIKLIRWRRRHGLLLLKSLDLLARGYRSIQVTFLLEPFLCEFKALAVGVQGRFPRNPIRGANLGQLFFEDGCVIIECLVCSICG